MDHAPGIVNPVEDSILGNSPSKGLENVVKSLVTEVRNRKFSFLARAS